MTERTVIFHVHLLIKLYHYQCQCSHPSFLKTLSFDKTLSMSTDNFHFSHLSVRNSTKHRTLMEQLTVEHISSESVCCSRIPTKLSHKVFSFIEGWHGEPLPLMLLHLSVLWKQIKMDHAHSFPLPVRTVNRSSPCATPPGDSHMYVKASVSTQINLNLILTTVQVIHKKSCMSSSSIC